MPDEVISNTSTLQYLHQIRQLDLLPKLYGHIIIPNAVAGELEEGRKRGIDLPNVREIPWIKTEGVRDQALLAFATELGPGEREALALATEKAGKLLLLDDLMARKHARRLGIDFTGTLGVLLKSKQSHHLTFVTPVLEELERRGFRLDPGTRAAVLKLAGE